jgi:hypothetical protein
MGADNVRHVLQKTHALAQRLKPRVCILPVDPNNGERVLSLQETTVERRYAKKFPNIISSSNGLACRLRWSEACRRDSAGYPASCQRDVVTGRDLERSLPRQGSSDPPVIPYQSANDSVVIAIESLLLNCTLFSPKFLR